MKELFTTLPQTNKADYLLDTCFIFWIFEQQRVKDLKLFCEQNTVAVTSFTAEEILHHRHDIKHHFKEHFRKAVHDGLKLYYIDILVHPGDVDGERQFVGGFDEHLLTLIRDPSDAVLAVAALEAGASVLTRDKHHLFHTELESYFSQRGVHILKELPK